MCLRSSSNRKFESSLIPVKLRKSRKKNDFNFNFFLQLQFSSFHFVRQNRVMLSVFISYCVDWDVGKNIFSVPKATNAFFFCTNVQYSRNCQNRVWKGLHQCHISYISVNDSDKDFLVSTIRSMVCVQNNVVSASLLEHSNDDVSAWGELSISWPYVK